MKAFRLLRFAVETLKALRKCNKEMERLGSCWVVAYPGRLGEEYHIKDPVLTEATAYESSRSLHKTLIVIKWLREHNNNKEQAK